MDRKEFLKAVRKGVRLRIDDLTLTTPFATYAGRGVLKGIKGDFGLEITLPSGTEAPESPVGAISVKDFWKLTGIIEDSLLFTVYDLPPPRRSIHGNLVTLILKANSVTLTPQGVDRLSHDQIQQYLIAPSDFDGHLLDQPPFIAPAGHQKCRIEFNGIIPGYELFAKNSGTETKVSHPFLQNAGSSSRGDTLLGTLSTGLTFCLVERGKETEFYLRSEDNHISEGEADDLNHFSSFQKALAFVHGREAWPFTMQHWRHGQLILDRVRGWKVAAGTAHTPFNGRLWYNSRVGNIQWDVVPPIDLAYRFFLRNSPLSRSVGTLLFHYRQAAASHVHARITATVLCPLLENLVRVVDDHFQLLKPNLKFEELQEELSQLLKLRGASDPDASRRRHHKRLAGVVRKTPYRGTEEIFRAVFAHLELKWAGVWEETFVLWKSYRNTLMHGGAASEDYRSDLIVESRIAGLINVIILRLIGYRGWAQLSAFDDKLSQI